MYAVRGCLQARRIQPWLKAHFWHPPHFGPAGRGPEPEQRRARVEQHHLAARVDDRVQHGGETLPQVSGQRSGRSSGSRIVLAPRLPGMLQWPCATFVPGYSGGPATEWSCLAPCSPKARLAFTSSRRALSRLAPGWSKNPLRQHDSQSPPAPPTYNRPGSDNRPQRTCRIQ